MVEKFQRKFLRIAAYRFNIPHPPYYHAPVLRALNISISVDCRNLFNLLFLSNLLSIHTIDCFVLFHIDCSYSNFLENSSLVHLIRTANNNHSFFFLMKCFTLTAVGGQIIMNSANFL